MNQIIVRTNHGEYASGSTIYGAVYLQLLEPVVADRIVVSFLGEEACSWKTCVPIRGDAIARSRSISQSSTDTGFQEGQETNTVDLSFREIVFTGKATHIKCDMKLKEYEGGVIPLGRYAFPFQLLLRAGLPNSFEKGESTDDVKRSTYNAHVRYTVSAMLKSSRSRSESDIKSSSQIVLRHEEFMAKSNTLETFSKHHVIKSCCCFKKGEISLIVTLDKKVFTLGETMVVKFQIENKSSEKLSVVRIRLMKTIAITGKREDYEGKIAERTEAFSEHNLCTVPLQMGKSKSKSFEVPIVLKHDEKDKVTTSYGSIVKCRCYLEVELDVPLDSDISVIIPIEIYPNSAYDWEQWITPNWIKDVKVVDAEGTCAVPRHILGSTEYFKVPLPLAGL